MLGLFLSVFSLHGQIVACGDYEPQRAYVFETVSFPNADDCEQIDIQCKNPELITDFEFRSSDTQIARTWGKGENPATHFPMKMNVLPGKIQVRYKMKGYGWKSQQFELEKGKPLSIVLEANIPNNNG